MKFSEWKTKTTIQLINLKEKYSNNAKALNDLDTILVKLKYAKVRDLSSVFFYMHVASVDVPELKALIPTVEDVSKWFQENPTD